MVEVVEEGMNDGLVLGQSEAFAEIVKLLEPFRKGDAEMPCRGCIDRVRYRLDIHRFSGFRAGRSR